MTANQWLGLLIVPLVVATGQILFKIVSFAASEQGLWGVFSSPTFWIAIFIYGTATLAWIFVIRDVPIGRAYIFMALTYAYVPAMSAIFLKESFSLQSGAGLAIILAGIAVTVWQ